MKYKRFFHFFALLVLVKVSKEDESSKKVIIHADFRSGSTFASDFFSKNDDFFYIYEPFNLIEFQYVYPNLVEILRDLLNCKFEKLWDMSSSNPKYVKISDRTNWIIKMLCWKDIQNKLCRHKTIGDFEKECLSYPNRAVKSIRIEELSQLMPLMEEGVNIMQLVRDPRGLTSSRLQISKAKFNITGERSYERIKFEAYYYCLRKQNDYAFADDALKENLSYFTQNYILVRYEDLSTEPMKTLERIYNKFDIKPDKAVLDWANTLESKIHDNDLSKRKIREISIFTERINSTETAFSWRRKMPFEFIDYIQLYCHNFLKMSGYKLLKSPYELINMDLPAMHKFEG